MRYCYPSKPAYRRTADGTVLRVAEVAAGTLARGDLAVRLADINHRFPDDAPQCGAFARCGAFETRTVNSVGIHDLGPGYGLRAEIWLDARPTGHAQALTPKPLGEPVMMLALQEPTARNLPLPLPRCAQHGRMRLRPGQTKEQRWCGTWYACPHHRCGNTVLLPSPALLASLEAQRKRV